MPDPIPGALADWIEIEPNRWRCPPIPIRRHHPHPAADLPAVLRPAAVADQGEILMRSLR